MATKRSDDEVIAALRARVEKTDAMRERASQRAKELFANTFDIRKVSDKKYVEQFVKRVAAPEIAKAIKEAFDAGKRL